MEDSTSFDWQRYRSGIHQAVLTLPHFLRNPVEGMRHLPDWDWPTLLTLQGVLAVVCGFLMDVLQKHFIAAIVSFFVAPVVATIANFIISGFFYYTFMFFFHRSVDFRRIFTHLLFASVPILLVSILTPIIPLVGLIGLAAAGMLLIVGFTFNFDLPMKKIRNLILAMFLLYTGMVFYQMATWRGGRETLRMRATPESLDILEKELKEDTD